MTKSLRELITKLCITAIAFVAVLVIFGWYNNIPQLVQIKSNFVPMQFNTALSFLLLALALHYAQKSPKVALYIGVFLVTFCGITLIQYPLAIDFGIDQLFFTHHIQTNASHPGRMAPNTALCFSLTGLAVSWLSFYPRLPQRRLVVITLGFFVFSIACSALLGYALKLESAYGWGSFTKMAVHTAILFALSTAVLLSRIMFKNILVLPPAYSAVASGLAIFLVTIALWQASSEQVKKLRNDVLNEKFKTLEHRFEAELNYLDNYSQLITAENFSLIRQHTNNAIIATARVNPHGELSAVYPHSFKEMIKGLLPQLPTSQDKLPYYLGKLHMSPEHGFITVVILRKNTNDIESTTVNLLSLGHILQPLIDNIHGAGFKAHMKDLSSNITLVDDDDLNREDSVIKRYPLGQQHWQVTLTASKNESLKHNSILPSVILFFGTMMSLLTAFTVQTLINKTATNKSLVRKSREKKHTLQQLSEAKRRLQLASDAYGIGTWVWDLKTNQIIWDSRMFHLYGLPQSIEKENLVYEHWYRSVIPEDRERAASSLQQAVESKSAWHEEFSIALDDGTIRHISAAAVMDIDENGEVIKVIGGNLDISASKQAEKRLKELHIQAEQSSVAKSQFLANMSHEIRTPLNGVIGITELLKNTELNRIQSEYLDLIGQSAHALLQIINDILDHSKIDAGMMQIETHAISLDNLVGSVVKSFAPSAFKKNLELYHYINTDIPDCIESDELRLKQILFNLIGNAVKFTETGHVTIDVQLSLEQDEAKSQRFILLNIKDTGPGISPDKFDSIFGVFTQGDNTTTRKYGGTGLGLPISKKLAELLGGTITVVSEVGVGSTFTLKLPLITADPSLLPQTVNMLKHETMIDFKSLNIVAVDDNVINRRWLNDMIISWGANTYVAENAETGFELLAKLHKEGIKVDVLLLDYQMPDKDGISLYKQLQSANISLPKTVIMLSSVEIEFHAEEAAKVGIENLLIKPVKQSEVYNLIQDLLKNQNASPQLTLSSINTANWSPMQILVAEDNPVNARLVNDILTQAGHAVTLSPNGVDALAKLKRQSFDAVLMDVQMPELDGLDTTRQFRKLEQRDSRAHTVIIGLTAHALAEDKDKCVQAGMDDYLTKPLDPALLLQRLQYWYQKLSCNQAISREQNALPQYTWLDIKRGRLSTGNNDEILKNILSESLKILPEYINELYKVIFSDIKEDEALRAELHKVTGMLSHFSASALINSVNEFKHLSDEKDRANAWAELIIKMDSLIIEIHRFLEHDQDN